MEHPLDVLARTTALAGLITVALWVLMELSYVIGARHMMAADRDRIDGENTRLWERGYIPAMSGAAGAYLGYFAGTVDLAASQEIHILRLIGVGVGLIGVVGLPLNASKRLSRRSPNVAQRYYLLRSKAWTTVEEWEDLFSFSVKANRSWLHSWIGMNLVRFLLLLESSAS